MASLTSGDNVDWLWGSLKPWQILHSTLAERERCGTALDVWELVNQTLSASTTREQEGDGGRSHGMHFLGDIIDGEFWRHGGVMETRVKECLIARIKGDHDAEELLSLQFSAPHDHHHHHHIDHDHDHHPLLHKCSTELAIAGRSCTHELPCAPRSITRHPAAAANAHDHLDDHCKEEDESEEEHEEATDQEGLPDEAAAEAEEEEEEEEEGIHGYTEEEEEEEHDDHPSAPYMHETIRATNYSLMISPNYKGNPNYRDMIRNTASVLVLNPCNSAAAAAGTDGAVAGTDQAAETIWGESGELEVPPDLEENLEVCAVCLEKLTHFYEEGVQALACRHAFHTVCIGPWMQRQPQACCPCCRAPIFPDNLAPPLQAPADLAAEHRRNDQYAICEEELVQALQGSAASSDIMGLLADMEAALEHLGLRS